MRTVRDRIRHALSFEIIGLVLVTPLAALAFSLPLAHVGLVGIGVSLIATGWTYLYNLGFDHALRRLTGRLEKSLALRLFHAALFELGLMLVTLPLIALALDIDLWTALAMDIGFALFYMVYAFFFNLAYDRIFPVPEPQGKSAAA